jgi:hypothetical protein
MIRYNIMHKNKIVAKAENSRVTEVLDKALCPNCIFVDADLEVWLKSRSIDTHRSNSRRLYKFLRMKTDADIDEIINIGHGITITDNWWIQREDESLDYYSLKQYNEELADISLFGFSDKCKEKSKGYTQLGTIGSYEKAWRFIDGAWHMFKLGSKTELISEYYAHCFLKHLNVKCADYKVERHVLETGLEQECIVTKDFTQNALYDFEPFFNYFNENEDPDFILTRLAQAEQNDVMLRLTEDYVKMCYYDALLMNVDRHNLNAGFLRDSQNGNIICLAPNFDYNLSLSAAVSLHFNETNADLMKFFTENDRLMEVMGPLMPRSEEIIAAFSVAEEMTKKAFPNDNFKYSLFSDYIISAYDYCRKIISK